MAEGEEATTSVPEYSAEDIEAVLGLAGADMEEEEEAPLEEEVTEEEKGKGGEEETTGDKKWFDELGDEDLRKFVSKYEKRDDLLKLLGIDLSKDDKGSKNDKEWWRDRIKDQKLRDHAGRFTTEEDLVKAHLDLRNRLSRSIVIPGKGASEEEKNNFSAAVNKLLGVPTKPEGYEFPIVKGEKLTDAQVAARKGWSEFFHAHHVPKATAEALLGKFYQDVQTGKRAMSVEDDKYAQETEAELKEEWGQDYDTNKVLAARAAKELFGEDFSLVMEATTSKGRLLMDTPFMLRALGRIGREMSEGVMDIMTDTEKETLEDQVKDVRKRADEAKNKGETRLANKLFAEEQKLLARLVGSKPIVGSTGRTV